MQPRPFKLYFLHTSASRLGEDSLELSLKGWFDTYKIDWIKRFQLCGWPERVHVRLSDKKKSTDVSIDLGVDEQKERRFRIAHPVPVSNEFRCKKKINWSEQF